MVERDFHSEGRLGYLSPRPVSGQTQPVPRDELVEAFRVTSVACGRLDSPLYQGLLARCADDIEAGGTIGALVADWVGSPITDGVALRFMGAVHRLVLEGRAPALASHYPSVGGSPVWPAGWKEFHRLIEREAEAIRRLLDEPIQTNEANRSAVLMPGFLSVARSTGSPLRILELGGSAGLNLRWDRFRYELGAWSWGAEDSPVVIRSQWSGPVPSLPTEVEIVERAACDLIPVDVFSQKDVRMLESFTWADQPARREQLLAAVELARSDPWPVEQGPAAEWVADRLAQQRSGTTTVVFHSIIWLYLSDQQRNGLYSALEEAGKAATDSSPLAWLRFEISGVDEAELRLKSWPGGRDRSLATAHPHGWRIDWTADDD